MSTWICGCDPEAKWFCENMNCDYRRHMATIVPDTEVHVNGELRGTVKAIDVTQFTKEIYEIKGPGADLMAEAARLVNGPRQGDYGTPKQNYEGIAKVWSGILCNILKRDITPEEAALMMVGLKLQRQAQKHKQDNLVDAHGYLLVYAHIRAEQ